MGEGRDEWVEGVMAGWIHERKDGQTNGWINR